MEHYTRLDKKEIETILARFDIRPIVSFEVLSGGSENTNYLINSKNGKYVLCICEQKTVERSKELTALLEHLEKNHFNTSKTVRTRDNDPITIWNGKPIMVKEFIEGNINKELAPHLLELIGQELGKLHQIEAPDYLPIQLSYGKEQFSNVKKYAANSEFDIWLTDILEYMHPFFDLNLPKSLIHADLFWDNVIITTNERSAIIMDFEEAAYYYRVFDIGMAIIGICAEGETVNLVKAKHLLTGYRSEISLSEEELKSLKAFTIYAGASMTFWRHQNFNHVKPDPQKFGHYLGLKVLVDFMREQVDDCFA